MPIRQFLTLVSCVGACILLTLAACDNDDPTDPGQEPPPSPRSWSWMHPSPQGNTLLSVSGVSEFDMWAVGEKGTVTRDTVGGGMALRPSPTVEDLYGVAILGGGGRVGDGFAVGAAGTILSIHSETVSTAISPTSADLHAIWAGSELNMVAVGATGTIAQYDGVSWALVPLAEPRTFRSVWGFDKPSELYAVGDNGAVAHFDGNTWSVETSFTSTNLAGVWADKQGDWFAVGDGGEIWQNRGSGWVAMNSPTTDDLYAVFGSDSAYVFTVGRSDSIFFYDSQSWSDLGCATCQNPAESLHGGWGTICALPRPVAQSPVIHCSPQIMVGAGGVTANYDLLGRLSVVTESQTYRHLKAIHGSANDNVFGVGEEGTILRYDGFTWQAVTGPVTEHLNDVWLASQNSIYVVGDNGRILHSADGDAWTIQTSNTGERLNAIRGTSAGNIYAVGDGSTVLRRVNDGAWTKETVPAGAYNDVWGSATDNVWFVGEAGLLVHYDGQDYSPVMSPTGRDLNAVWGSSANNVFVASDGAFILQFDGNAWAVTAPPASGDLHAIAGNSSGEFFAIGDTRGVLLRFDGSRWVRDDGPAANTMTGLWESGNALFVAGESGNILKYEK